MPKLAAKPCRVAGCRALVTDGSGYCEQHRKARQKQQDEKRGTRTERGYSNRWSRYRESYLAEHPLCIHCKAEGVVKPATEVDHIVPHRGDWKLFWDPKNHQPLCKPHHSRKTASEDGAFGNPRGASKV